MPSLLTSGLGISNTDASRIAYRYATAWIRNWPVRPLAGSGKSA
jgi:hypothetical protein